MATTGAIAVRELTAEEVPIAIGVAARAFRDSPPTRVWFGDDPLRRLEAQHRMFDAFLTALVDPPLVGAFAGPALVGLLGYQREDSCIGVRAPAMRDYPRPSWAGADEYERVLEWLFTWGDHDPREPHWHVAPVAVDPPTQGMGFGSALLEEFCARADGARTMSWLETDKPQNVRLYERFGFEVTEEMDILGAHNWWMRREPR